MERDKRLLYVPSPWHQLSLLLSQVLIKDKIMQISNKIVYLKRNHLSYSEKELKIAN